MEAVSRVLKRTRHCYDQQVIDRLYNRLDNLQNILVDYWHNKNSKNDGLCFFPLFRGFYRKYHRFNSKGDDTLKGVKQGHE